MRLLIVSQFYWPENFRVNDLTEELTARGHEVTVLTGQPNYPDGDIFPAYQADPTKFAEYAGAPIHRVPVIPRGKSKLRLIANYLSFVVSGLLLGPPKLRGQQFDGIFVFQTSPITAALPALWLRWRKRAPLALWVLDVWPDTLEAIGIVRSKRLLKMVGALVRFIYKRCDLILIQSRAFVPAITRWAPDERKIRYFPGWAESAFAEDADRSEPAELTPYAGDFKLLFAGNLGEAQDVPAIIAAADLLRDVDGLRWIIVGDGRAADDARAEVERRGLSDKVVFLGRFPIDRMPGFFEAADALLVSLKAEPIWSLTIPGKVQSYLAAGKPILGMLDGEGARVISADGAGLAGPASDPAALADNVRRLMAMSPEQRAEMGEAGRRLSAREFDRSVLVDRLEGWFNELARSRT